MITTIVVFYDESVLYLFFDVSTRKIASCNTFLRVHGMTNNTVYRPRSSVPHGILLLLLMRSPHRLLRVTCVQVTGHGPRWTHNIYYIILAIMVDTLYIFNGRKSITKRKSENIAFTIIF